MVRLPEEFLERMEEMLGEEFGEFLASYEEPRKAGIRVNGLKCGEEEFEEKVGRELVRIPWVENGFFVPDGVRAAQWALYAAGVFYLQEPSAMTPASRLPVWPGERVLDLCAAPGGKATELAAKLKGRGVLVANDISNARAKALLHNLELFGAGNVFVTNEVPGRLGEVFEGFFDKVLVDAPCSGEGMFRKDEAVIRTWTPERPEFFANLQRDIVANAVRMLREGGLMMYSTCTFAPQEDEGTISWLLREFPEMQLMEMEGYEGFSEGRPEWGDGNPELRKCVRIWPHRMHGEGHFLALLKKKGGEETAAERMSAEEKMDGTGAQSPAAKMYAGEELTPAGKAVAEERGAAGKKKNRKKGKGAGGPGAGMEGKRKPGLSREEQRVLEEFLAQVRLELPVDQLELRGGKVYLSPELPDGVRGIHFLRNGLFLGELKKDRFEPSQPFAMALSKETYEDCLDLRAEDERVNRYLKGETIPVDEGETRTGKGWKLVCVEGFALGWGKLVGGVLKNKYAAGWRR